MWSTIRAQGRRLGPVILDRRGPAEDHHGAVVDGVVKGRAGQDQAVDQGHRHSQLGAGGGGLEDVVGGGAVQEQAVAVAAVAVGIIHTVPATEQAAWQMNPSSRIA